ncbi:hypothetical protein SBA6_820003 [Candidatus Sulfopaludibacter sp. SbA6]|nr:hypothetical protein SBA6_820003 [Candidatus Sulfopaludibacter sp. SbA6]
MAHILLHRTKEEEKVLIKHWFVYGLVLAGLGILGEFQREREKREDSDSDGNGDGPDLSISTVGRYCAGIARVVVPIIRSLYKGPVNAEAASTA